MKPGLYLICSVSQPAVHVLSKWLSRESTEVREAPVACG